MHDGECLDLAKVAMLSEVELRASIHLYLSQYNSECKKHCGSIDSSRSCVSILRVAKRCRAMAEVQVDVLLGDVY